jgi:hypothetical protein
VSLANNLGFKAAELRTIEAMILDKAECCKEAWHEFFDA